MQDGEGDAMERSHSRNDKGTGKACTFQPGSLSRENACRYEEVISGRSSEELVSSIGPTNALGMKTEERELGGNLINEQNSGPNPILTRHWPGANDAQAIVVGKGRVYSR